MIGTTISHYEILLKLGEGGMGVVYRGTDLITDRPVAIKLLALKDSPTSKTVIRFQREAKEGLLGFEVTNLQQAINLGFKTVPP